MENIDAYLKFLLKELKTKFRSSSATRIAKHVSEAIKSKNTKDKNLGSISKETVGRFITGCKTEFKKKINDYRSGKESTLDIFAISLGYDNFFDFCQKNEKRITTEELFDPDNIHPSKLKKDDIITIGWKSIRVYVDAKYLGRNYFEVMATEGTERVIGEKFNAKKFIIRNIMYFNDSSIGYKSHPQILFMDSEKKWNDLFVKR